MAGFDWNYFFKLLPLMLKYLGVTLKLSILAMAVGLAIAVVLALVVHTRFRPLYVVSKIWISFFRGTPLIAQLFFMYFGVVQIIPSLRGMDAFTAGVIGLSFNASAYMAETLRGALESVDKGQMEAALSVGMTYLKAMRRIVMPQAARAAIPALSNSFVDIIKGSAIIFTIGVTEIMAVAQSEGASSYRFLESFTAVIIVYWVIITFFSQIQKVLEVRMSQAYQR